MENGLPRQCEHWLAMTGLLTVILWMGRNSLEIYLRYHRFSGSFFMFLPPKYKNVLVPPMGNKDRKLCGATLFAGINRPLCPVPTHRLPVNAGNASEDTKAKPVLPALGGPFAAPLFAPLSALGNSLWMRLQLYFRVCGFLFKLCLFNTKSVFLSRTFFHARRTNF